MKEQYGDEDDVRRGNLRERLKKKQMSAKMSADGHLPKKTED